MATTTLRSDIKTTELRLASGNGPVTRTVLCTPLRDALPSEIPIIDVARISSSSLTERKAVARQIYEASTNTGFFYIRNHGIPNDQIRNSYRACLDFFHQEHVIKSKADATQGPFDSGWRGPNTQRVNPDEGADFRETYSLLYDPHLDPTVQDPSKIPDEASQYIGLGKPPFTNTEQLPQLRESLIPHYQAYLSLARALTRTFALSLELAEDAFDKKVQYPDASMEINFYPPIDKNSASKSANETGDESPVSIGSHTDFLLFTMLWQDNVGGLQVLNHEGQWIAAKPVEDTLVVNIGDYLQHITNDKYKSTVHRARNSSGKERISIPFFWGFGLHESCEVLGNCLTEGETSKYEEVKCVDWVERRLGHLFDMSAGKPVS